MIQAVSEALAHRQDASASPVPVDFAALLLRRVAAEDLARMPANALADVCAAAFALVQQTSQDSVERISLVDLDARIDGRTRQLTQIGIVNDNMPFLLDSALSELADQGFEPLLVAHPILAVVRDPGGAYVEIKGEASARAPEGARRES